jgi:hypothetical protein
MRYIYSLHEFAGAQVVRRDTCAVVDWQCPALDGSAGLQNVLDEATRDFDEQPPRFRTFNAGLEWMNEHEAWNPGGLRGPVYARRISRREAQEYINAGAVNCTGLRRKEG